MLIFLAYYINEVIAVVHIQKWIRYTQNMFVISLVQSVCRHFISSLRQWYFLANVLTLVLTLDNLPSGRYRTVKNRTNFNLPKFLKCGQSYQSFLTVFIRFVLTHIFTVFETVRLKSFNIHMWIIKGTYIHFGIVVTDVVMFVYFSAGGNMEGEPISPLRRTFCLIVLFDLIITVILWLIFTEVGGNVIS